MYPSIQNDLKDWQVETRAKAGLLLYTMLYHSEQVRLTVVAGVTVLLQDTVMHTERVLGCLVTAARDTEAAVRGWARRGSLVLGHVLPPGQLTVVRYFPATAEITVPSPRHLGPLRGAEAGRGRVPRPAAGGGRPPVRHQPRPRHRRAAAADRGQTDSRRGALGKY